MTIKWLREEDGTDALEEVLGYSTEEFITTSAGVADAGKPIKLDANGLLDASFVDTSNIDHGNLTGLGDDDHVIYTLADGTRNFTGIQAYSTVPSLTDEKQLVHKGYVDSLKQSFTWYESALDQVNDPPVAPIVGQRYLVGDTPTGDFVGHANDIADYNGTIWDYITPVSGGKILLLDDLSAEYRFDGAAWIRQQFESTTASNGCVKIGDDIQIDPNLAGNGLAFVAGIMSVNVDDSSIEIVADTLNVKALGVTNDMLAGGIVDAKLDSDYIQTSEVDNASIEFAGGNLNVKADGIKASMVDFGLGGDQVSASDILIADSAGNTAESHVEGALSELYSLAKQGGVTLNCTGVSKGDLMTITADDTLSTYSTITSFKKVIGLAASAETSGNPVKCLANDVRLDAVGAGWTAGDIIYWDGSSLTNTKPGTGKYSVVCGQAINATDLYVQVGVAKKQL